jgi:hypothetical protein
MNNSAVKKETADYIQKGWSQAHSAIGAAENAAQYARRARSAQEGAMGAVRTRSTITGGGPLGPQKGPVGKAYHAAKGFFGAMDYAKAGGMKQFGVGAARVGLAAAGIGLGMKALSALNPFSD